MIRTSELPPDRLEHGDDAAERESLAVHDDLGESVLQANCLHFSLDRFAGFVYVDLDGSTEQCRRLSRQCVGDLQVNKPLHLIRQILRLLQGAKLSQLRYEILVFHGIGRILVPKLDGQQSQEIVFAQYVLRLSLV